MCICLVERTKNEFIRRSRSVGIYVGQMLVAKLKKLGAQEHKVDQIVASLSFEDIRKCLPLTDDDLKKAFAKLFA